MNNIYIYICLLCGFLMTAANLSGQVTIGSNETAKKGAILDLKENINNGPNSTRGLLLPRVHLTDKASLYPMFDGNNDYINNVSNTKKDQDLLHSGLTVYNTNECFLGTGADRGVYVWTSTDWKNMMNTKTKSSNANIHTDQDQNKFYSKLFGTAGEWMLQNVKAKNYASKAGGGLIPTTGWKYPNSSQPTYDERPDMGLLYKWDTAMNSGDGTTQTQGVCPDGWHIPSDAEWNLLETEIYNKINDHSNVIIPALNPTQWSAGWDAVINGWRGTSTALGHGNVMKAICPVPGITKSPAGNSSLIVQGGFNALLTGVITFDTSAPLGYGSQADFWSATTYPHATPHAINRTLSNLADPGASNQVRRNASNRDYMMSIRCKLDEGFANCGDPLRDSEGNEYPTVKFGNVCWMTENLRSKQGLTVDVDYVQPTTAGYEDAYGMLYAWDAATKSTTSDILLAGEPGITQSDVTGICPNGWYIPSDLDWTELEKEIAVNPDAYTTTPKTSISWELYYDEMVGWRPGGNYGWGEYMKLPTSGQPTGTPSGWGYSKDSSAGIAVIFTGAQQKGNAVEGFTTSANIWSSTEVLTPVSSDEAARYRGFANIQFNVYRGNASKTAKLSVRCIKRGV